MLSSKTLSFASPLLLAACAAAPIANPPISQYKPDSHLSVVPRITAQVKSGKVPETFFAMGFSGGGTRAAAFSYGVLEELRRTMVTQKDGKTHSLIEDLNAIGGVSGGGFTALSYALYGDKLFEQYEKQFLKRDVQGALTRKALNPANWAKLSSSKYGRAELAEKYYDEILFKGATFGDLLKNKNAPLAVVTATELSSGIRFAFDQDNFNVICSDLSKMKLSRAAAATSSVPGVFSPIALHNYGGKCGYQYPDWAKNLAQQAPIERPITREAVALKDIEALQDSTKKPFLHLVDGGISDNLGIRGVLDAFARLQTQIRADSESGVLMPRDTKDKTLKTLMQAKRIIVIAVNARTMKPDTLSQKESAPSVLSQLMQSSNVPMGHYSQESITQLHDLIHQLETSRKLKIAELRLSGMSQEQAVASVPSTKLFVINIDFEHVKDPKKRQHLLTLPTSFYLPEDDVDLLRETGATLLRESPEFKRLLLDLKSESNASE
jgi:NTE family protein